MSITLAAARLGAILGNIIFGVFVDVACAIPILLVASLLMCMSILQSKFVNIKLISYVFHRWWSFGIITTKYDKLRTIVMIFSCENVLFFPKRVH